MVNHSLVSHFQKKWNPDPTQPKLFWGGTMFPPQCASYLSRPFLTFTVVVADSLSQDLMHKWPRLRVREDCQPDLWASWLLQHRVDHVSQVSQQAGLVTLADCCHLNLFFFLLWPKKARLTLHFYITVHFAQAIYTLYWSSKYEIIFAREYKILQDSAKLLKIRPVFFVSAHSQVNSFRNLTFASTPTGIVLRSDRIDYSTRRNTAVSEVLFIVVIQ